MSATDPQSAAPDHARRPLTRAAIHALAPVRRAITIAIHRLHGRPDAGNPRYDPVPPLEPPSMQLPPERRPKRPLPKGLSYCDTCGLPRGRNRLGWLSTCLCQGVRCRRCLRWSFAPMSSQYDVHSRSWGHLPWFGAYHTCRPTDGSNRPSGFDRYELEPDHREELDATTAATWAEVSARAEARAELEAVIAAGGTPTRTQYRRAGILYVRGWSRLDE
jgi:hypothetical protein